MFRRSLFVLLAVACLVAFVNPTLQAQEADAESAAAQAAHIAVRAEIAATLQLSKVKVRQLQRLINRVNDPDERTLLQAQLGNIALSMQFNQKQLDANEANFLKPGTAHDEAAQAQRFAGNHVLADDLFKKAKKFFVDGKANAKVILGHANEDLVSLNEMMLRFWY